MTTDQNRTQAEEKPCYQSVIIVGPPGVGKGTQGKLLAQIPGIFHISSGDMFRQLDENSKLGKIFHQYANRGELVPDNITVKIWQNYVQTKVCEKVYNPASDLLVLDGIPRNVNQATSMEPYLNLLKVIYMVCEDREVMFQRIRGRALKENRQDDTDEVIVRYRWNVYKRETEPIIDYYPQELIRSVDADTIPAEVLRQILEVIVPVQKKNFTAPLM